MLIRFIPTRNGRRRGRRSLAIGALTLLAIATTASACSSDDGGEAGTTTSSTTAADTVTDLPESTPGEPPATSDDGGSTVSTPVDPLGAIAIAVESTPGAVIEIDRGSERGQDVWEVLVRREDGSGREHYISIATGEILKQEAADVPGIAATLPAITIEAALATAAQTVPGSELIEADLETEGSRTVWEILVRDTTGQQIELYIDAATGEVVKQEAAE